jgi:hypothetical protein
MRSLRGMIRGDSKSLPLARPPNCSCHAMPHSERTTPTAVAADRTLTPNRLLDM